MNAIVTKILIGALVAAISGFGGYILNDKLEKPIPSCVCPQPVCPEPTVSVQPFDVEKIKGVKSFNYSPQFTGSISVAGVDSTRLKQIIQHSVDESLQKYVKPKFLR
jgi:hypothetical protein